MRQLRLPPRDIAAATALLLAVLWGVVAWLVHDARRDAVAQAYAVTSNLAHSLAEYEDSSVRAIDLSLRLLREDWRRAPASFDAAVAFHETALRKENVIQIAVVDADANLRYSRIPQRGPLNFSDRDYFQEHKRSGADELYVSAPVFGRITRQWAIQFSRPIRDSRGRFVGLIVMAVPPPALESVYNDIRLGPNGVISLARPDGTILARTGQFADATGVSLAGAAALRADAPPGGDFRARGRVDGIDRFISYRRLETFPLTVFVGQSVDTVLGPYHEQRVLLLVAGGVVTAMLLAGASLAASRRRERQRFLEERERLMLDLHDSCIQSIYAIGLGLESSRRLLERDPARAAQLLAEAGANLNLVIQDLRTFISGEPRAARSEDELVARLRRAAAPAGEARPEVSFDIEREALRALSPEQAVQVERIAQEALSNVVRHAGAKNARLSLALRAGRIQLDVADDGSGLGGAPAKPGAGLGLHHIRARARKLGGRASIGVAPGGGTRVLVEFPSRP